MADTPRTPTRRPELTPQQLTKRAQDYAQFTKNAVEGNDEANDELVQEWMRRHGRKRR
jgi:hypothetical protein